MKKSLYKGHVVKVLCTSILMASVLTGCKGTAGETGTSAASQGESAAAQSEGAAASEGKKDGILDVGYTSTPDSLTPFRPEPNRDAPYMNLLCESLAVLTSEKELAPWIAKTWSTNDNGFTYDIEIHQGIKDSAGNDITAADIVWYIQTAHEKALKPVFAKVESVKQTGDYTLQLKLTSNVVGSFDKIMTDTYAISQKAFGESTDEFGSSLISTSPYKVTEFTANSVLAFELREDYWQDINNLPECVRPQVDKITYHSIPEASQMGIALETGTIDMALRVDSSTGAQFVGNDAYTVELTEGHQGWQVFFSGAETSPLAENVKLRQAICYAIDAQGLVTGLCAGYGTPMYDAHSPIMIGYNEKWNSEDYYSYDVEKAKALVAESGYDGQPLKILASSATFPQRLAQMMQSYLMAVGINVELNVVDPALYTATRLDGTQYDMVINTIGGTYLSDAWAIRYDPAAYSTGDATSRHDEVLAELLYKTWTPEGWTEENIDEVHYYLKDNAISYGMVNPQNMAVWRNDIGLETEVKEIAGYIAPAASTYNGL
ncbi:MAG: ABC transporter substrate-binding protein [Lachnospiraceae bacterium]